jgi:hypothetical protein
LNPPPWRLSGGRLSRRLKAVFTNMSTLITARATKIPRQDVNRRIWPPRSGARIGVRPPMIISSESSLAAFTPE